MNLGSQATQLLTGTCFVEKLVKSHFKIRGKSLEAREKLYRLMRASLARENTSAVTELKDSGCLGD